MKLSVIIVNYNVRYFLEQSVRAALRALENIDGELIVVDNASGDGSKEMMASTFPYIAYHFLEENVGFSKGNNIGINASKGEYVLLLNPDTVVAENAFEKAVQFMDEHPDGGGLGVHMIDGDAQYLPESKRGLPTPIAAFYKIFGLSSLFPNSKRFGRYHVGYLDKDETHEVEILSGAFMLMRRSALDKAGLLDETFFMYGEDIDLSYRLTKAGFRNYYYPESRIIHYKGESTKKGSVNYVFVFYRAMVIFTEKHFEKGQASLFGFFINLAIYFRAALAILRRLFGKLWQILLDAGLAYGAFLATTSWYGNVAHKDFDLPFVSVALVAYASVIGVVLYYAGAYDRGFKILRLFKGWTASLIILLGIYALLPEAYRFSRAVLLIGSLISLLTGITWRLIFHTLNPSWFKFGSGYPRRSLVVGNETSLKRIKAFFKEHAITPEFIAGVSASSNYASHQPEGFIGDLDALPDTVKQFRIDELVFDTAVISNASMIAKMEEVEAANLKYKMAVGDPLYIIGSQETMSENTAIKIGELRTINMDAIRRLKRTVDLTLAIVFIPLLPVLIIIADEKIGTIKNLFRVLVGRISWVGLDPRGKHPLLPQLKEAAIYPNMNIIIPNQATTQVIDENMLYLRTFTVWNELTIISRHLHAIGNA